jgi:RNA polymerase sigma factor (sigma-70 family)
LYLDQKNTYFVNDNLLINYLYENCNKIQFILDEFSKQFLFCRGKKYMNLIYNCCEFEYIRVWLPREEKNIAKADFLALFSAGDIFIKGCFKVRNIIKKKLLKFNNHYVYDDYLKAYLTRTVKNDIIKSKRSIFSEIKRKLSEEEYDEQNLSSKRIEKGTENDNKYPEELIEKLFIYLEQKGLSEKELTILKERNINQKKFKIIANEINLKVGTCRQIYRRITKKIAKVLNRNGFSLEDYILN